MNSSPSPSITISVSPRSPVRRPTPIQSGASPRTLSHRAAADSGSGTSTVAPATATAARRVSPQFAGHGIQVCGRDNGLAKTRQRGIGRLRHASDYRPVTESLPAGGWRREASATRRRCLLHDPADGALLRSDVAQYVNAEP